MQRAELDSEQAGPQNYTSSQRKLKKITQDLPFNPPSTQHLEEKINQMRQKISKHTEMNSKPPQQGQDHGSDLPPAKQRMNTETTSHYNVVASLLSDRVSKASLLNRTNDPKPISKMPPLESYKEQCIIRDKDKHPMKYKIVKEEVGLRNDAKVYDLRQDQIHLIQQQFMRRKGLEYLREGNNAAQRFENRRFYSNSIKNRASSFKHANSGSKVHQIFGNPISQSKRIKSQKSLKPIKGRLHLVQLKEQEEMLGKIVFQKVKKHLKEQKLDSNYFRRVYSEETIDQALVDFLKAKIERAQASINK